MNLRCNGLCLADLRDRCHCLAAGSAGRVHGERPCCFCQPSGAFSMQPAPLSLFVTSDSKSVTVSSQPGPWKLLQDLVEQVEMSQAVDRHGHRLENLKALREARAALNAREI